jgi:hypothetical protein
MDMHFDPTFRVGDIFTIITFIGVGIGLFFGLKYNLKLVGFRLDIVDATLEDVKLAVKNDILQNAQIAQLQSENTNIRNEMTVLRKELYDLRGGKGWIQEEVNGEYNRRGKVNRL